MYTKLVNYAIIINRVLDLNERSVTMKRLIFLNIIENLNNKFFDFWRRFAGEYTAFVWLIAFLLPFIEALLPFLPLIVIVSFNIQILTPLFGSTLSPIIAIILSSLGSFLGTFTVFLFIRGTFGLRLRKKIENNPKVLAIVKWLENRSNTFITLVMSNPYTPGSLFNYAMAITNIDVKRYFRIALISKTVNIIFLTLLGIVFQVQENVLSILWVSLVYAGVYLLFYGYNKIKNKKKIVLGGEKIMSKKTIADVSLTGKTTLMRVDFNVPMKDGQITDDNRIVQALPTIKHAINDGAKVVLFSHLGRIKEEADKAKNSLASVAKRLSELLDQEVKFIPQTRGKELEEAIKGLQNGEVLMFENTRFEDLEGKKESKNDPELGAYWASLGEVFVNDAFGTAHRAHASNVGIASNIDTTVAGFLMEKEIKFIGEAVENPTRPFVAILGGAKVSDKISVIENLLEKADKILIAGAMAYTFLKAQGINVGISRVEEDYLDFAKSLLEKAQGKIILPVDHVAAKEFKEDAEAKVFDLGSMSDEYMGLDIGPKTIELFKKELEGAKTVVWNGPAGVFEFEKFSHGTNAICETLANLPDATTIIGGGDSAAAAISLGYEKSFTHISTGGGASLEYLEGKELPGIAIIEDKCTNCDCK